MVHPHGCGEDIDPAAFSQQPGGSPPRVWGRRAIPNHLIHRRWFTPTGVGKTRLERHPIGRRSVHPHGCGEDGCYRQPQFPHDGSPPRVWGRLPGPPPPPDFPQRFTPTGVGKTTRPAAHPCQPLVHPHGCGEDNTARNIPSAVCGSPPRVWGRPQGLVDSNVGIRFTPTGVGKTRLLILSDVLRAVHPHGCGEDIICHLYLGKYD